ncbi:MAG TPA: hypothetical protein VHO29_03260 [Marmoricola sp.]|nr:hypothetical protein [Marmoricola sp.]
MTPPRRTPTVAALAAVLVLSAGCESTTGPAGGMPTLSAGASAPSSASSSGTVGADATPSVSTRPSTSACPSVGSGSIPDGTWSGPVAVTVRGSAPGTATRGTGSGLLQVVVEGGRVTGGTWTLAWDSAGPSTAKDSNAKVTLHGQVAGTVSGTAASPVLAGRWAITGRAVVTSPVTATATVNQARQTRATLSARTTACDAVTGTFAPSFRSTDAYGSSDGTATWTGRRTG